MFVLAYGVKGGEILLVIDRMFLYLFQLMGVTFPFKAFFNCKFWCFYVCFIDRICGHYSFTYSFSISQNLTRVLFCEGLFCNLLRSSIMER